MTINKGLYILNVENNISNKYKYEQNQDFLKAKNNLKVNIINQTIII